MFSFTSGHMPDWQKQFPSFANQMQYAQQNPVKTPWGTPGIGDNWGGNQQQPPAYGGGQQQPLGGYQQQGQQQQQQQQQQQPQLGHMGPQWMGQGQGWGIPKPPTPQFQFPASAWQQQQQQPPQNYTGTVAKRY